MGTAAGPIGAVLSLASTGFSMAANEEKARGEAAGQEFMAGRAERAAALGRIKADQTDAQMREELRTTLANIDAIRASANVDPNAPTALAIKANETRVSDRERMNRVTSLKLQAAEDETESRYRRYAASSALTAGRLGTAAIGIKGLAGAIGSFK